MTRVFFASMWYSTVLYYVEWLPVLYGECILEMHGAVFFGRWPQLDTVYPVISFLNLYLFSPQLTAKAQKKQKQKKTLGLLKKEKKTILGDIRIRHLLVFSNQLLSTRSFTGGTSYLLCSTLFQPSILLWTTSCNPVDQFRSLVPRFAVGLLGFPQALCRLFRSGNCLREVLEP